MSSQASTSATAPPSDILNIPSTTPSRSQHSQHSQHSPTMPRPPSTSSSLQHPSNASQSSATNASSLPHSPESQRQIAEARTFLEASMSNIGSSLDHTLRSRAETLHSNSKQLQKQEKDVAKATEGLKKEGDKLGKMAAEGARKVKELGNVQNWAEMLERDFLVLGETLRLANRSRGSWSGSESDESWETESEDGGKGKEPWWRHGKAADQEDLGLLKYVSPLDAPLDAEGDTTMGESYKQEIEADGFRTKHNTELSMDGMVEHDKVMLDLDGHKQDCGQEIIPDIAQQQHKVQAASQDLRNQAPVEAFMGNMEDQPRLVEISAREEYQNEVLLDGVREQENSETLDANREVEHHPQTDDGGKEVPVSLQLEIGSHSTLRAEQRDNDEGLSTTTVGAIIDLSPNHVSIMKPGAS